MTEARRLTDISYCAHLEHLMGRVRGKKKAKAFVTAASMAMRIKADPLSKQYSDIFDSFTSLGFEGEKMEGAKAAKELYLEIYSRIYSHLEGRDSFFWIQKL